MADWIDNRQEMDEEFQDDFIPEPEKARRGGPQGEDEEEGEEQKKKEERERKKAEVRKRLEEAGRAKKAKKGFLTPDRKKKLRKLLMMKAAEDLKQQQMVKEKERQRILNERIIPLPDVDSIEDSAKLEKIANDIYERIKKVEEEKYDLEYSVRQKDFEINELTIAVNDLRGKFVKPTLKKISKYDNKFKKMAENQSSRKTTNFKDNLKKVQKDKFNIDDLLGDKKKEEEVAAE
jgi:hypothetical protein